MTLDTLAQIGITLFGGTAIYLVGRRTRAMRRWGFVCGLISQPCWYLTMAANEQWLMLPVFAFYTYSWISGFINHWLRAPAEGEG